MTVSRFVIAPINATGFDCFYPFSFQTLLQQPALFLFPIHRTRVLPSTPLPSRSPQFFFLFFINTFSLLPRAFPSSTPTVWSSPPPSCLLTLFPLTRDFPCFFALYPRFKSFPRSSSFGLVGRFPPPQTSAHTVPLPPLSDDGKKPFDEVLAVGVFSAF